MPDTRLLDRRPCTLPPLALLVVVKIVCSVVTVAHASTVVVADIGSLFVIADAATRGLVAAPCAFFAVSFFASSQSLRSSHLLFLLRFDRVYFSCLGAVGVGSSEYD